MRIEEFIAEIQRYIREEFIAISEKVGNKLRVRFLSGQVITIEISE